MAKNQLVGTLPSRLNLEHAGDISKGHLSDAFSYSDLKSFTVKKTGKDIIGAMDALIAHENAQIILHKAKAVKVEGIDPKGNVSEYATKGYSKQHFGEVPKVYSYYQKYPEDAISENKSSLDYHSPVSMTMSGTAVQSPGALSQETKRMMNKYNSCINYVVECMVEIKIAETVKNGVEDKKSYDLTIKQAAALGF